MVIDFHTHAFPEKIAKSAISTLAYRCGNCYPKHEGTIDSLMQKIKQSKCDKAVVLNIATNPKQQKNVNDFAISLLSIPDVIPFGSVHPDSDNAIEELIRLKEAGIKGIKLHPNYQNFFVDDERLFPIYEKVAELGLITVFHSGVDIGLPDPISCTPDRLLKILPIFKGTPVVAAHMGGYLLWQEVLHKLAGTEIYLDTSYSFSRTPPPWANQIIQKHGADKILFGSDTPWSSTEDEIRFIESLDLTEQQKEQIYYKNAAKLLGI
ncbi:MAG: amidohydrolase [Clostridia bacterium]|nr:amidohydrolase [Clostridia bacterium]